MKKLLSVLLVLVIASGFVFANGEKEAAAKSDVVKIGLIIENTIDDKGWCQAMHDGIVAAQKALPGKIEYRYTEKMKPVDAGSAARQYAAEGFNIIIGHGAQYKNLILELAEEYPNITFAYGTSGDIGPANVFTYMPESEETGYLNGLIAGLTTKTNIVGYVGPVDGGDAARYGRGFVLGVKKVNPKAKILVTHTGSFSDYVKAGEFAQSNIKDNADVLTGASQQAIGALTAVAEYKDKDIWWVGQDIAQISTAEGYKCIAASSYAYSAVIVDMVGRIEKGVKGGQCIPMNFNNGGFIFQYNDACASKITPQIKEAVSTALDQMKAKPNTIPYTTVNYDKI